MKLAFVSLASVTFAVGQNCALKDDRSLTIDQSAKFQSCIDSTPDYSTIHVGATNSPAPHVRINSTIRVNGRYNLAIECPGGKLMSAGAPGFYWGGAEGGTVLNTSGSSAVRIEHCNFYGSGIMIDADISSTVGSNVTTTEHIYNDLGLQSTGTDPGWVGIRFSASGDANVEAMRVTGSRFGCSVNPSVPIGKGIYIAGYTFDAIRHRYSDNDFNYCDQGIRALYGIPDIGNNHFQTNNICITAMTSPLRIHDNDSENCGQFYVGAGAATTIIESNRIAACHPPPGKGCIETNGPVISQGNTFDFLRGSRLPITSDGNGNMLSVHGDGYNWPTAIADFYTGAGTFYMFEARGIATQGIVYGGLQGGNAVVFQCGHGGLAAPMVDVFCYNTYTGRIQISTQGGPFIDIP